MSSLENGDKQEEDGEESLEDISINSDDSSEDNFYKDEEEIREGKIMERVEEEKGPEKVGIMGRTAIERVENQKVMTEDYLEAEEKELRPEELVDDNITIKACHADNREAMLSRYTVKVTFAGSKSNLEGLIKRLKAIFH